MHTDSEMKDILRSGFMHCMTVASLEMSDEPYFVYPNRYAAIISTLLTVPSVFVLLY